CQFQMIRRDGFGIDHAFDVHWKISTQAIFADLLTYDELLAEAVPVPSLGPHARAAGHLHALLLACIHPVMHHRNSERLLWLYDIHLLATRLPDGDLERFTQLAIAKHVARICRHQLSRCATRFGTPVPARLLASLEADRGVEPSEIYLRQDRRWHDELASSFKGLPRWRDRARLLREVILPGPGYLLKTYGLTRWGFLLLPVLYSHRCLRGFFRILTGRK
ncbi:MAG TPA: nucleotidyltransferase family protein, partial [Vicinamibacterales bacterium]|nr:nucleotidyltransferase family protein [Vicinamibacterales bacterium]